MLLYLLLASLRGALPVTAAPREAREETPGQLRSKADEALLKTATAHANTVLGLVEAAPHLAAGLGLGVSNVAYPAGVRMATTRLSCPES